MNKSALLAIGTAVVVFWSLLSIPITSLTIGYIMGANLPLLAVVLAISSLMVYGLSKWTYRKVVRDYYKIVIQFEDGTQTTATKFDLPADHREVTKEMVRESSIIQKVGPSTYEVLGENGEEPKTFNEVQDWRVFRRS